MYFPGILLICAVLGVYGKQTLNGRIVGGFATTIRDYPYQALLEYRGQYLCGGGIIAPNVILTAAHCVDRFRASGITVRVGSAYSFFGDQHRVYKKIVHPKYDSDTIDYDIAIVILASKLVYSPTVQPIRLPEPDYKLIPGSELMIAGWGALNEEGGSTFRLREVTIPVVDINTCRRRYSMGSVSGITKRMFCGGYLGVGKRDTCQGDSGSPVVQNGLVVGIVSWGYGCGDRYYPGIYTNVPILRTWIRDQINL